MIHAFLRPPAGPAGVAADVLRILAAACIVVAGVGWGPVEAATIALAGGGMLLPRLLGVRPAVDIAFGVVVLVAAWSSVLEIYITTRWWDLPVHFLLNGLCAALCYIALVQLRIVPDAATLPRPTASVVVVTVALGLSLGVFWEMLEWFGHTFIDEEIYVGYVDSIGDLAWGGAGALAAGFGMPYLTGRSAAR
jgi:hypothetical protein